MQRKFQVFVSSTYTDLIQERQETLKSILDLGHIPAGMEGFFAADEEQLQYIKRIIDECDFYVLIIGGRYGSTDDDGISYTEREYDYAVWKGITVLAFIHEDIRQLPPKHVDTDPDKIERLAEFRKKVSQRRLVSYWRDKDQLKAAIIISLSKSLHETNAVGWVRADVPASEDILVQINELRGKIDSLTKENSSLREQLRPKVDDLASLGLWFIEGLFCQFCPRWYVRVYPTNRIWTPHVTGICDRQG